MDATAARRWLPPGHSVVRRRAKVGKLGVELFGVADPEEARGDTITARELLDEGARRIETVHAGNLGSERARNHGIGAFKSRQHLGGHLGRPALATTQQRVERAIVQ